MSLQQEKSEAVRLDKWLWAARFYKARSMAREMVEGGKVHYNGQRSKPGKVVEVGALIRFWQGHDEREVEVLAITAQRRGAPEAQLLYRETEASVKRRHDNAEARKLGSQFAPSPERRPDKQERRLLIRAKQF
ncbi:ribosome-associated heat shock protein Hsp15 [Aeromonas diversa]|uniref:ribosome-associated heat shock protein Hsp15 n=1 Tax=Aeromonas diversa TaxID=502790 RepID=UPI0003A90913|nr:ribosome-associated heat shock protein Hsp15 [Aeromonas diversa]